MAMSDSPAERAAGRFPIIETDFREERPAFWHFEHLDEVREMSPFLVDRVPQQFWMVTRYDHVKEALQNPTVFTNDSVSAFAQPDEMIPLLPQLLNPPEHTWYRQVLNVWFSPGSVKRIEPLARSRCVEMIEELRPVGHTDMASEFAMLYPTEMFLAILGLPVEDGAMFLPLVETIFHGFFGGPPEETAKAMEEIKGYFKAVIDDRLTSPGDLKTDFVTHMLNAQVNGQPVPRDEVELMCFTIMLAGLDTTRSALGYIFHHLATHDEHRQLLVDAPDQIPAAVEEFIRLYGLLIQDGRYVAEDIDFHGCPMKQGDIVWLGLQQASRDPRRFERPTEFVIDRKFTKHMGFGMGNHRCLGAHLARLELILVLEEWLARIPDFRVGAGGPMMERGGQIRLSTVPIEWDT
jgi:cytochrome P450